MELALGTVQFGLPYGIAGRGEPVPESEVRAILEEASYRGIRLLDTAASYGDIETRLRDLCGGLEFRCISKIPAVELEAVSLDAGRFAVEAFRRTQDRLGGMLESVLFHRATDLVGAKGREIWDTVCDIANESGIRLGVSCYAPEEIGAIQSQFPIEVAQVPGSAFDQRLRSAAQASGFGSIELHLRSVFLQGLLLMPYEAAIRRLPAATKPLLAWHAWCADRGFTPLVGALAIAKGTFGVKYVIVGVDSLTQLKAIISAWDSAPAVVDETFASADLELIDPRRWKAT